MSNCLYFICPTDHLETIIKQAFKQNHYFFTSLGNSVVLDPETVRQINGIVESEKIEEITFLLSRDNDIIQAALKNHNYSDIKGMCSFYHIINNQMGNLNFNKRIEEIELELISSYLNKKTNELRSALSKWLIENITINALIYYPQNNFFVETQLFKLDSFYLN